MQICKLALSVIEYPTAVFPALHTFHLHSVSCGEIPFKFSGKMWKQVCWGKPAQLSQLQRSHCGLVYSRKDFYLM